MLQKLLRLLYRVHRLEGHLPGHRGHLFRRQLALFQILLLIDPLHQVEQRLCVRRGHAAAVIDGQSHAAALFGEHGVSLFVLLDAGGDLCLGDVLFLGEIQGDVLEVVLGQLRRLHGGLEHSGLIHHVQGLLVPLLGEQVEEEAGEEADDAEQDGHDEIDLAAHLLLQVVTKYCGEIAHHAFLFHASTPSSPTRFKKISCNDS